MVFPGVLAKREVPSADGLGRPRSCAHSRLLRGQGVCEKHGLHVGELITPVELANELLDALGQIQTHIKLGDVSVCVWL